MDFRQIRMTAVVFYHWDHPLISSDAIQLIDQTFEILGNEPDRMFIGYEHRRERNILYPTGRLRVRDGHAEDYAYLSGVKLFEPGNARDLEMEVCLSRAPRTSFRVIWKSSQESPSSIEQIVEVFSRSRSPLYGIGYRMPFSWGPPHYAMGMGKYRAPENINDNSASFGRALRNGEISAGRLRGLYPVNILSQVHDTNSVNGMRLHAWIAAEKIGSLVQVGRNSIWHVPREVHGETVATLKANNVFMTGFDKAA